MGVPAPLNIAACTRWCLPSNGTAGGCVKGCHECSCVACRPSNPPSASDIAIEGICEYALNGYGQTKLMEFEEAEVVEERDKKRQVKVYKEQKQAEKEA